MICLASEHTKSDVRQLWKTCFDDTDDFIELYFSEKYKSENTLIYVEDGKIVSSLQMLPYTITFYGEKIPVYYLSGLCTLPEHRAKGYIKQLMEAARNEMKRRDIPLSILIPANESLYRFYECHGYQQVFEKDDTPIPLKQIITEHSCLEDVYTVFDRRFQQKDFCVQKTFDDFKTIVREYNLDGCPPKTNLSGMARVMDVDYLFRLYKRHNPTVDFDIAVCESDVKADFTTNKLTADIRTLCRLLFGFRTNELGEKFATYFPRQNTVMNLMLE